MDAVPLGLVASDEIQDLLRNKAAELGCRDANGALRLAVPSVENAVAGVVHEDTTTRTTTRNVLASARHRDGAMPLADRAAVTISRGVDEIGWHSLSTFLSSLPECAKSPTNHKVTAKLLLCSMLRCLLLVVQPSLSV